MRLAYLPANRRALSGQGKVCFVHPGAAPLPCLRVYRSMIQPRLRTLYPADDRGCCPRRRQARKESLIALLGGALLAIGDLGERTSLMASNADGQYCSTTPRTRGPTGADSPGRHPDATPRGGLVQQIVVPRRRRHAAERRSRLRRARGSASSRRRERGKSGSPAAARQSSRKSGMGTLPSDMENPGSRMKAQLVKTTFPEVPCTHTFRQTRHASPGTPLPT